MGILSGGSGRAFSIRRSTLVYGLGSVLLLVIYTGVAVGLSRAKDWAEAGPLALARPALEEPLDGGVSLDRALNACFPTGERVADAHYKVVGGYIEGRPYYACYEIYDGVPGLQVQVIAGDGTRIDDARVIKQGGAWPAHGMVLSPAGFVVGGTGLLLLFGFGLFYYRRRRERIQAAERWWGRPQVMWLVAVLAPVVGWLAVVLWPRAPWGRRLRVLMQAALCYAGVYSVFLLIAAAVIGDGWALAVYGFLSLGVVYSIVAGRTLLLAPAVPALQNRVRVGSQVRDASGRRYEVRGARLAQGQPQYYAYGTDDRAFYWFSSSAIQSIGGDLVTHAEPQSAGAPDADGRPSDCPSSDWLTGPADQVLVREELGGGWEPGGSSVTDGSSDSVWSTSDAGSWDSGTGSIDSGSSFDSGGSSDSGSGSSSD